MTGELAVVYSRISSTTQESWGGLNSQAVACRQYCDHHKYEVIKEFKDVISGGEENRPGLNELLNFIDEYNRSHSKKITIFVTHSVNRIARSFEVHLSLTTKLRVKGIRIETVEMKFEETPIWKLIEWIMALQSEYFRNENTERVISRQEARLLDGYRSFDYPIGYVTTNAPAGGKLLIPDEPNASIIKEALEGYAFGRFNSISEVTEFLTKRNLDLSRTSKKRKKDSNIIHNSLTARILKQILYTGYIQYHKTTYNKKGLIKKQWNIPLRKGKHEWIIDLSTYYTIQEKLIGKRPYEKDIKKQNNDFPLRWYLVCDCCNLKFSSGLSRSGSKKQIPYYQYNKICQNKGKSINANHLHHEFEHLIKSLKPDNNFLDFMKIIIQSEYEKRNKDKTISKQQLQRKLRELDKEIDNLIKTLATTNLPLTKQRISHKIEEAEMKKLQMEDEINWTSGDTLPKQVIDIACSVLEDPYYIREGGYIEQKQALINILFSKKIPINKSTGTFWTLPLNSFYLYSFNNSKSKLQTSGGDESRTRV